MSNCAVLSGLLFLLASARAASGPGRPSLLARARAADPGRPSLDASGVAAVLASSDLVWHWDASGASGLLDPLAPLRWSQSAYVGNGLVGAAVTAVAVGAATPSLRIDLSRTDIWECSQREPSAYLTLTPRAGALARVDARLVLAEAALRLNLTLAGGAVVAAELRVSAAGDGRDDASGVGALTLTSSTVGDSGAAPPLAVNVTADTSGPCSDASPAAGSVGATAYSTQHFRSGGSATVAWREVATPPSAGGGSALFLVLANSQRRANATASQADAVAGVAAAAAAGAAALAAASNAWWWAFWTGTSFFSFAGEVPGATALETFAVIAGYRYAASARYSMHDLMGAFGPAHATTCIGPWCQYCWDMNQQVMMYLPTPSNRGPLLAAPAFDMADSLLPGAARSWAAAYGSNSPGAAGVNVLWWLAQLHRYCRYHGDDARVAAVLLPLLRGALQGAALANGTDGRLHVLRCTSPEYPMPPSTDCAYDLAILRWAAQTAAAAAAEFAPADPARALYADIVARLAPLPVDAATGSWELADGVPFRVPHRHYSHLLALHDLGVVDGAAGAAAASLDVWWAITCAGPQAHGPDFNGDDECRGFTQAGMAVMSAMLERPAAALGNLTSYLSLVGLPNAMYGEEVYAGQPGEFSPVAESAFAAAAAVYRLLLASAPSPPAPSSGSADAGAPPALRLWPAAPAADASFFRLRAEGALLVSAVRAAGATAWVAVEADLLADGSGAGTPVAFTLGAPDWAAAAALVVIAAPGAAVTAAPTAAAGVFAISGLVRGAAAAFYAAGAPPPPQGGLVVGAAPGRNASEFNRWGSTFVYKGELP